MDLFPLNTGTAGSAATLPVDYPPVVWTKGLVMGYYDGNTVTALWNYAQHYALNDNSYDTHSGRPRRAPSMSSPVKPTVWPSR